MLTFSLTISHTPDCFSLGMRSHVHADKQHTHTAYCQSTNHLLYITYPPLPPLRPRRSQSALFHLLHHVAPSCRQPPNACSHPLTVRPRESSLRILGDSFVFSKIIQSLLLHSVNWLIFEQIWIVSAKDNRPAYVSHSRCFALKGKTTNSTIQK